MNRHTVTADRPTARSFITFTAAAALAAAALWGCDQQTTTTDADPAPTGSTVETTPVSTATQTATEAPQTTEPQPTTEPEPAPAAAAETTQAPADMPRSLRAGAQTSQNQDSAETLAGPRITFDSVAKDFGTVYEAKAMTFDFDFKNTGNDDLTITRVSTSCGCTAAKLDKRTFAPGEGELISVTYTPRGNGRATKYVTILSNDPVEPRKRLSVSAEYIAPVMLQPQNVQLGLVRSGETHTGRITILSKDENLSVVSAEAQYDFVTLEPVDDAGLPPVFNYPGRKIYEITIAPEAPSGPMTSKIDFVVEAMVGDDDQPIRHNLNSYVFAQLRGDIQARPRFFRVRATAQNQPFESTIQLVSEKNEPFNIENVEIKDATLEGIEVEWTRLPEDARAFGYDLTLKGNTQNTRGAFRGRLLITTDRDNEGPVQIGFNGIVRPTAAMRAHEVQRQREAQQRSGGDNANDTNGG